MNITRRFFSLMILNLVSLANNCQAMTEVKESKDDETVEYFSVCGALKKGFHNKCYLVSAKVACPCCCNYWCGITIMNSEEATIKKIDLTDCNICNKKLIK